MNRSMLAMNHRRRIAPIMLALLLSGSGVRAFGPPPPPPGWHPEPAPPAECCPPPDYYPPPPPVVAPPPLSPVMRAVYAPFYVAGLVFRYGFYYGIVAPFEVFARALSYGVEGGVDKENRDK